VIGISLALAGGFPSTVYDASTLEMLIGRFVVIPAEVTPGKFDTLSSSRFENSVRWTYCE
jgi:hypothetical protein